MMSVAGSFQHLLSCIELNPTRVELASERYNSVKSLLEATVPGKHVTQIGSFQRRTKIRPADLSDDLDIDVLVGFGPADHIAFPPEPMVTTSGALATVQAALSSNRTYRLMGPRPDFPTVRLEYSDGISMEIVPAFIDRTGFHPHLPAEPECYLIGTSHGAWVPADYDYDAYVVSGLNRLTNGLLVPSIKMIKAFLRNRGLGLRSFHVEILCARVLPPAISGWTSAGVHFGFPHLLSFFLANVWTVISQPVCLLGSHSTPIDSEKSAADLFAIGRYLQLQGTKAWQICAEGDTVDALRSWRQFFGEPFPAV